MEVHHKIREPPPSLLDAYEIIKLIATIGIIFH
jgi:hypothetical protein